MGEEADWPWQISCARRFCSVVTNSWLPCCAAINWLGEIFIAQVCCTTVVWTARTALKVWRQTRVEVVCRMERSLGVEYLASCCVTLSVSNPVSLLPAMAVFEAATIIRTAPWLTMLIFIWSVVSGLFGGKRVLSLFNLLWYFSAFLIASIILLFGSPHA